MNKFARQRGYSIVEIAIVLVAFSLLLGGSVLVVGSALRDQHQDANEEYMLAMHDSILAYAATHRTPGVNVVFAPTSGVDITLYMPPGRPVLPCPDLNGDGLEDRNTAIYDAVTVSLSTNRSNSNPLAVLQFVPGRCLDTKGLLPWRTLGTRAYDQWGQMYTYFVDNNFSNATFGFDQLTRASTVFKHLVVPVTSMPGNFMYVMHSEPRRSSSTTGNGFADNGNFRIRDDANEIQSRVAQNLSGMVLERQTVAPGHVGAGQADPNYSIVAGVPLISNLAAFRQRTERRLLNTTPTREVNVFEYLGVPLGSAAATVSINIDQPAMADGIAFAVVSHGRNGAFGVTYRGDYIGSVPTGDDFTCGDRSNPDERREEAINGRRHFICEEGRLLVGQAICQSNLDPAFLLNSCASTIRDVPSNGVFYTQKRTRPDSPLVFDDIVTWMMPNEISDYMHEKGLFPLTPPPVALFPATATFTNPDR